MPTGEKFQIYDCTRYLFWPLIRRERAFSKGIGCGSSCSRLPHSGGRQERSSGWVALWWGPEGRVSRKAACPSRDPSALPCRGTFYSGALQSWKWPQGIGGWLLRSLRDSHHCPHPIQGSGNGLYATLSLFSCPFLLSLSYSSPHPQSFICLFFHSFT